MTVAQVQAERLVRAYGAALRERDQAMSPAEGSLLVALVAESAAMSRDWFATRHGDDQAAVRKLDELVVALVREDTTGRILATARKYARSTAANTAMAVITSSAVPWVIGVIALFVAGVMAAAGTFGEAIGMATFVVVAIVVGGPIALPLLLRGGAAAAVAAQRTGRGLWSGVTAMHDSLDRLGVAADHVFDRAVVSEVQSVLGAAYRRPQAVSWARRFAWWLTMAVYALAVAAVIVFGVGVRAGFELASEQQGGCYYNRFTNQWVPPGCRYGE